MESYKILTNWRVIFISVFSLFLSFSVNAESSEFDSGCAAPSNFVKSSFNSITKDVYVQWAASPGAVAYRVKASFDDGSTAFYTVNGNTSKIITAPAAAKSIIITIQSECATGQLSIGKTIILSIIATQGDINDILGLCQLIDLLLSQGFTDFSVVHPVTGKVVPYLVFYEPNCPDIEGGLKGGRLIASDELAITHFPNPFLDKVTIRYQIPNESSISLALYDVAGKLLEQSIANETKAAGIHEYEYQASQLNPGVYFYKLEINGKATVSRIVKMK